MNFSASVVDVDGKLSRLFAQLPGLNDAFVMPSEPIWNFLIQSDENVTLHSVLCEDMHTQFRKYFERLSICVMKNVSIFFFLIC